MAASGADDDPTRSFTNLAVGTRVSHYRIISKIGAGGMGEVYLAEDTELHREVALKFLPLHLCQDEDCRRRFKREAQAAAKLDHPNIVPVYEVGEFSGRPYFVMAHIEGRSLYEVIKDDKLSISDAVGYTIQICEGLHKAHASGVVHRDIKPGNIIIDRENRARIVDFGLATVSGQDKLTKTGSTLGTVGYMSPEQIEGKLVDHRSDLFSVGVILYEILTSHRPFEGDTDVAIARSITDKSPEPIARYKSGTTGELQQIIDKALSKDASLRYQHADGMLADLRRLGVQSSITSQHKRSYLIAGMLLVLIIAVALSITRPWQSQPETKHPDKIMLAVLPFQNLGEPEDEYFADGITDEIISRLARLPGLGVISRTSAIQYKSSDKSLPEIANELGVDYILEGSIRWDKTDDTDKVRITPQLIQVSDNTHIWADAYERAITGIFSIQAEIASNISDAFGIVLLNADRNLLQKSPTDNLKAYQFYLRARHFLDRPTNLRSFIRLGIQYLDSAVNEEPDFALAYAELSVAHSRMYHHQFDREESRRRLAKTAAAKSLELDPTLPEGKFAMGCYYYWVMRDYETAAMELNRALQGKPNDSRIYELLGYVNRRAGRWDDAVENLQRSLRLNPRDAQVAWEIANAYSDMGRYVLADQYCRISLRIEENLPDAQIIMVRNYWKWYGSSDSTRALVDSSLNRHLGWILDPFIQVIYDGKYLDAVKLCESLPRGRLLDGNWYYSSDQLKGWAYILQGNTVMAKKHFQLAAAELEARLDSLRDSPRTHSELGIVYAYLGNSELAIKEAGTGTEMLPVSRDAVLGPNRLRDLALTLTITGHTDEAVSLVDSLLRIPSEISVPLLLLDKRWAPLYNHPRFQALIDKYEKEHAI
jgi:serine/threonine protein kinase/tetratricopeptide (TPR) repeat protein